MRFIKFDDFAPTEEWKSKATAATTEAAAKPATSTDPREETRAKFINSKADIWKALKDDLASRSHAKCWYCECRQARSDKHVDHFRPKNRVRDDNSEGYWWLAFDHRNYRFSCAFCNSPHTNPETGDTGGKSDFFPLRTGSGRASSLADLPNEVPVLLDPTDPNDPGLLYFEETGEARPAYSATSRPFDHERAKVSVERYHLDHPDLREARRALAQRIKDRVIEGTGHFARSAAAHDPSAVAALQGIKRELRSLIEPQSEYSAAARRVLSGLRNHEWIEEVLAA